MADFLTTLATRTLGLTPVMQPMIASVFTAGAVGEIYPASAAGEYESFGVNLERSLQIPRTDEISIPPQQLENPVLKSIDEQVLTSNQQTSESEIKSTFVNSEKIAPIAVKPVVNQVDSIPEENEIKTVFPIDSPERPQNTLAEISINYITPSSINQISQIDSKQVLTGNRQTDESEIKSTLVNLDKITPIRVESVVNQVDLIREIDQIKTAFPKDIPEAEISINPVKPSSTNPKIDSKKVLTGNQQTAESEVKSTLVNSEQITPIRVEPVVKQIDSLRQINEISNAFPNDFIETEISINPVKQSSINPKNDDKKDLNGNQQTAESQVKATLVNSEQITPIRVEPVVKQIDSIREINEISNTFPENSPEKPQNTLTKISVNSINPSSINPKIDDKQDLTGNQQTDEFQVKSTLVNSGKITPVGVEPVIKQLDSLREIDEIKAAFPKNSPEKPQNTLVKIAVNPLTPLSINQKSEIDYIEFQQTSESAIKPTLVNLQKTAPSQVESLNNKDQTTVNNNIQNNLTMGENTSNSPHSILTQPQKLPDLNSLIVKSLPDSRIPQNLDTPDVVIPQNSLESVSLSQKTASKIKPVVMTHPSSVYPQMELESRQSERINQREPVPATQTPTPTITVSIGRIEVRVSNQSTSPKTSNKSTRKEPGLSLQDYLKQRQGGK